MSAVIFTLVIREEDQRIRKRKPPCGKVFRDRKKYTRKEKHKGRCRDTAAPLAFLCLRPAAAQAFQQGGPSLFFAKSFLFG